MQVQPDNNTEIRETDRLGKRPLSPFNNNNNNYHHVNQHTQYRPPPLSDRGARRGQRGNRRGYNRGQHTLNNYKQFNVHSNSHRYQSHDKARQINISPN